jgi:hypothetical protein
MSEARKRAEEARSRLLAADNARERGYAMEDCAVALEALLAEEPEAARLHFVCTDFPGPKNECVFVECEDGEGHGVNAGEWIRRPDGLVALVVSRRAPLPPEVREAAECTGIAASWCPVHGNCSCPRDEEGARTENRFGVDCPLHGLASNHGDAEVSALAARRGA